MDKNNLTFEELRPEIESALLKCISPEEVNAWELVDGFMHSGLTERVNGKNDLRITIVGLIHSETYELKMYPLFKLLPHLLKQMEDDN